ncbi:MAG: right-handed parallel beta-helix repeat-containing protein [Planctomycetota bacterium]
MSVKKTLPAPILVLIAVLFFFCEVSLADVIFSNFDPNNGYHPYYYTAFDCMVFDGNIINIDTAMPFIVSGGNYSLTTIDLAISRQLGENEIDVTLTDDFDGQPGETIETIHLSNSAPNYPGVYPPTVAISQFQPMLTQGNMYWIILSASGPPDAQFQWHANTMGYSSAGAQRTRINGAGDWIIYDNFTCTFRITGQRTVRTIYVDANAPGNNDGTTWYDAYNYLQDALTHVQAGDRICIAGGIYKPDQGEMVYPGDISQSFNLVSRVVIQGGYAGYGHTNPNERDIQAYRTILSGDLNGDDDSPYGYQYDNSYHVVKAFGVGSTTVLDGVTITRGNATGSCINAYGAGLYNYCAFPKIIDCTFILNYAEQGGGAIYNVNYSNPAISGCIFVSNHASAGGAIKNEAHSWSSLANCVFVGNSAARGGAIFSLNSALCISNCTFYQNGAYLTGGGISANGSSVALNSCIVWANISPLKPQIELNNATISISYSNLQGKQAAVVKDPNSLVNWGMGNIEIEPLLTPDGHLQAGSPCINMADPNIADPNVIQTDVDGELRIIDGRADIGADEFLDSDADRLPNSWEKKYFADPNSADPNADPDNDTLVNLAEFELYSSNPLMPPVYVDPNIGDDSYDGSSPIVLGDLVGPKASLQAGINAAKRGNTVLAAAGVYSGWTNMNLDFQGKAVVLCAPDGPNQAKIDGQYEYRPFNFYFFETYATAVVGFSIINGYGMGGETQGTGGGAVLCELASPHFRNCVFADNYSYEPGGAIYCRDSIPMLAGCLMSNNWPDGMYLQRGGANIAGNVVLITNDWHGYNAMIVGAGTIITLQDAALNLQNSRILCKVIGLGTIEVDPGEELTIEGSIDMSDPNDPNEKGQILCSGLLRVKANALIQNARMNLTRASFEGESSFHNNIIIVDDLAPPGQFFIEDTVDITDNDIYATGDRFIDFEPNVFQGIIENNRIYITITDGVGKEEGGLLELRGLDGLAGSYTCDPNNIFFCMTAPGQTPDFNMASWTIERLELIPDAKLNLTNRIDYQPPFDTGGSDEVLYVKELILGDGAILNTSYNKIYYESLVAGPNAIIANEPLLGFSLVNITMDDQNEFLVRVTPNNYLDPEPFNWGDNSRTHIERTVGVTPDVNGMMQMTNLVQTDPCLPNYSQVISARAKGLFAKATEDEIIIIFEYLFTVADANVELVVYLSDEPELLDYGDPCRESHYLEAARLRPPPAGRYGSPGSGKLAVFETTVSSGNLNFIRGIRMELELVGPEGSSVLINNWDPFVSCVYCGDVTGDAAVTVRDFLTVLGEYGKLSSDTSSSGQSLQCLNSSFTTDGFINGADLSAWDWGDYLATEGIIGSFCFSIPIGPSGGGQSSAGFKLLTDGDIFNSISSNSEEILDCNGPLLIAGKRYNAAESDFLSDRLYDFDASGNYGGMTLSLTTDRLNNRLIRDHNGVLYQLNTDMGMVRISDETIILPRNTGDAVATEPRYSQPATVYAGFQGTGESTWGRPVTDVAFDPNGYLYITPVVVVPDGQDAYTASAKLQLATGQTPPYNVLEIYDDPPLPGDNQDANNIREIEVDENGDVFVINNYYVNNSDRLWVYKSDGDSNKCELQALGIYGPTGLCNSVYDSSRLYLASSQNQPTASSTTLYVFSKSNLSLLTPIQINDMGHVVSVIEDPATGTVWVLGFKMASIPTYLPLTPTPFWEPYLASVPYDSNDPVTAVHLNDPACDLQLPLSIVWTGIEEKCGGADLDGMGDVSFSDFAILALQWLQAPGSPPADIAPKPQGDGIVNLLDLAVLAEHWLESGCADP